MRIKNIFLMLITILISGCAYTGNQQFQPGNEHLTLPEQTPYQEPQPTPAPTFTPELYGNLPIDNISSDLNGFYESGWWDLYEKGEFDCSRMTTYLWDYIRNKHRVAPKIAIAPERHHAWLALRVVDTGDNDRYSQWTIKGVKYYFIETTVPRVVTYEKDIFFGNPPVHYNSSDDFYTTEISLLDDPVEANIEAGRWFNEFRLTKSDLDKLDSFRAN